MIYIEGVCVCLDVSGIALLKEFVARGEGTVSVEAPPDVEAIAEALRKGDHHVTRMLDEIGGVVWR